jgi:UDP-N-acetylmuramoyl-tripeptide--D-alanyl-D-alanine ligase
MSKIKNILKSIIIKILTLESKVILKRFNPRIIAITGSVGKTTTKDVSYSALKKSIHVRKNEKSFNSEIGVPLTILGLPNGWSNPRIWINNVIKGFLRCVSFKKYPDYLILEVGVDRPGDIEKLTKWLKPDVAVMTRLPERPAHVEFFNSKEDVWNEKRNLISAVKKGGAVVLNNDDEEVINSKLPDDVKVFSYGKNLSSDVIFDNYKVRYQGGEPVGISASIKTKRGDEHNINLDGVLGDHHIYPAVAAISIGMAIDIPVAEIIEAIGEHNPTSGRMRILKGYEDSILIDDTYNSSPTALTKAIEEVGKIESKGSKIAILGDMLELGKDSSQAHREAGETLFSNGFEQLVTVGVRASHIAEGAISGGMKLDNVACFPSTDDVDLYEHLSVLISEGDVLLIKGSQGSRMEKVTKYLLKDQEEAKDSLVRQDNIWLKK